MKYRYSMFRPCVWENLFERIKETLKGSLVLWRLFDNFEIFSAESTA